MDVYSFISIYKGGMNATRVVPDMIFFPDAGYPAGLSGMSCRIFCIIRYALPDILDNPAFLVG